MTLVGEMAFSGSYHPDDVTFLLKPSSIPSVTLEDKELLIQSGARHYSEMLSPETIPDQRYMELYRAALDRNAARLRADVATLARAIAARPDTRSECVIVSLARAGTPIGILIKRALERLGIEAHHYSISIIRGRGIDFNALRFIHARHGSLSSVFVDGWTGKGAIKAELERSLAGRPLGFRPCLAVVADPAGRADIAATIDDYVIPSGLLNCIVSGLVSRSVLTGELVGPDDFHACLFQEQHRERDVSRAFIAEVEAARGAMPSKRSWTPELSRLARLECGRLMDDLLTECSLTDVNRIKPGIAEATRALLRRVPDRVYVADVNDPEVRHMRHLAARAGVHVIERDLSNYRAVTIIKSVGGRPGMTSIELGATLYVPALNERMLPLASGINPDLRSMIICLEDAVREDEVPDAMRALAAAFRHFRERAPAIQVYVRPRDVQMLVRILAMPGVGTVDGFVLPKVTLDALPHWLAALAHCEHRFMPTIEGSEAFCRTALGRLCDQLRSSAERVTAVRIGGNDILGLMGLRRSRFRTAYDGPLGNVIRDIARTFIPNGFDVSAPVFEHFTAVDVLREEVEQDIEHGLLTKTAIHPSQLKIIQELYRPNAEDFAVARSILDKNAPAVFGTGGSMCEPATHRRWASSVVRRAQIHGIAKDVFLPAAVA